MVQAPVVSFAARSAFAERLQPLVAEAGCSFFIDENRPDLLVVHGQSILHTMTLADLLIEHRDHFS